MMNGSSRVLRAVMVCLLPVVAACQHTPRQPRIEGDDYAAGWLSGWLGGVSSMGNAWTRERIVSYYWPDGDAGSIPLHRVVLAGEFDTVQKEIARNRQALHEQNDSGATALHIASYLGETEIVSLLLDRGASLSTTDHAGRTALLCALIGGRGDLALELIERGSPVNARDAHGSTGLQEAVVIGRHDVVRALLQQGASPEYQDWGYRPLHIAAGLAIANVVAERAPSGICKSDSEDERRGPRHVVVTRHDRCFFRVSIDESSTRPCSRFDDLFIAQALLEYGAEVDARDPMDGNTPLHIAVKYKNPEVARLLLEHGADPYARNMAGLTAFDLASGRGGRTIRQILRNTPRWTPPDD